MIFAKNVLTEFGINTSEARVISAAFEMTTGMIKLYVGLYFDSAAEKALEVREVSVPITDLLQESFGADLIAFFQTKADNGIS